MELDYDDLLHLDAEELAECGIADAYRRLLPELSRYIRSPATIEEIDEPESCRYAILCGGERYDIWSPELDVRSGWRRAAFAPFDIIKRQLTDSTVRFFAINSDNDLGGMFLTPEDAISARASLPRRVDWPYLPTAEAPWHGQHH